MPLLILGPLLGFFGKLLFGGQELIVKILLDMGPRFFLGLIASLYFTSEPVRHAVNAVGKAVIGVVL